MVPLCNFHLLVGDLSSRKWKMSKSEWKRGWASESPSEDYPDWTIKEWNFYYIRHWYSPVSLDLVRLQLVQMSFKWDGSVGKKSACNAVDAEDSGSIPGSRRFPGKGNGNPLQYSCWKIPWTEEPGRLQSIGLQKSQTWLSDYIAI